MSENVYKIIEITGSSPHSSDQAVKNALAKAAETVRNMRWFEVIEMRGAIEDGKVTAWQVTIKVGFTLEDGPAAKVKPPVRPDRTPGRT